MSKQTRRAQRPHQVMIVLIREFQSPDPEMKKIVLKVVKQCCATDGVEAQYIREEILPPFFEQFWVRRLAPDRRTSRQVCFGAWPWYRCRGAEVLWCSGQSTLEYAVPSDASERAFLSLCS
jgi:hypothetical protein